MCNFLPGCHSHRTAFGETEYLIIITNAPLGSGDLLVEVTIKGSIYLWNNYYAGGAAVGEIAATSGTCWFTVKGQHSSG